MDFLLFILFLILVTAFIYQVRNVGRRPRDIPPGPPTLPLIGNLHQIPNKNPHHQYKKWAEQYGPVYSLILGTKTTIVISSSQVAKDLLDKRSGIYSSRPEVFLAFNIASGGLRFGLMPYGAKWRMVRKIVHTVLHVNASKRYNEYQDLESKQMLCGMLEDPRSFRDHLQRFTNSLSTQIIYGFRTLRNDDEDLKRFFEGFEKLSGLAGSAVAAFLDIYPILRNLPTFMLPSLRYAQELHKHEKELYMKHWMRAKERFLKDTPMVVPTPLAPTFLLTLLQANSLHQPCLCDGIAESQKTSGFSDDLAAYISGTILEAGSDTTSNTLAAFLQAMLLYPAVQERARQELDSVCGTERSPTLEDADRLPYIRACAKESLRWMPTAVLGLPHAVTQDDEYMGYRIPEGATILLNVWAINTDPVRYRDPWVFDPSRFEGDDRTSAEAAMASDPSQRDQWGFGAGRRICPGMHVADRSLFLGISRLLWAFEFRKARDDQGREITPDPDDVAQGLLMFPRPFPLQITPRSEKHAQVVREEWEACQALLDESKQWREIPKSMISAHPTSSSMKS